MCLPVLEKDSPSGIYLKNWNDKAMQMITPAKV